MSQINDKSTRTVIQSPDLINTPCYENSKLTWAERNTR